jgi:hypothetical protein
MPRYNIVTSVNNKYWNEGSRINLLTWDKNLLEDIEIHVYHEDEISKHGFSKRVLFHKLYKSSPELVNFISKHKHDPHYNGTKVSDTANAYKWNGIKFAHKTYSIFHRFENTTADYLIWLDADMLIHSFVSSEFLSRFCNKKTSVAYLGRPTMYSECGFVAYNLKHPVGYQFLKEFKSFYEDDKLKDIRETHDSFVFDQARIQFDQESFLNLNKDATVNKHPVTKSILYEVMVHTKGEDKIRQQLKFVKRFRMRDIQSDVEILHKLEKESKDAT